MLELMPPFYFLTFAKVSKKFGLKKSWYRSRKHLVSKKKSRYRSRKHLVSKKSLGIGLKNIWSRKKVSVSVSKTFGLKKSLGIGLENMWSRKKVSVSVSKILVSKKVSVSVSMKFFGLVTQWLEPEIDISSFSCSNL